MNTMDDKPLTDAELAKLRQINDPVRLRALRLLLRYEAVFRDEIATGSLILNFNARDKSVRPTFQLS